MSETIERAQTPGGFGDDEISILDLLVILARQKRTITRTIVGFSLVGLAIAIFSSSEYTSSATVIREIEEGASASSSALDALRGFGIGVGGATSGLTADAYPDIVKSREVRLAVARESYQFTGKDRGMTFVEFVADESGLVSTLLEYTIGLPGKLVGAISGSPDVGADDSQRFNVLSDDEELAVKRLAEMVRTSEDLDSGLMKISVVSDDRLLSVQLALGFVDELVERVRNVYIEKSRQNLDFIQDRFAEAELALAVADSELAQFEDRNIGVTSARLETERQRLRRQVTFKSQLYSDLQTQLTQTEIELQRAEPVITVLERPVPSKEPTGPRRSLTLVLFIILGGMVGVALAFVRTALEHSKSDAASHGKIAEIIAAIPRWPWSRKS